MVFAAALFVLPNRTLAWQDAPLIANSELKIRVEVESVEPQGIALAQGGERLGYALHFVDGVPVFDVRISGKVTRLAARKKHFGHIQLVAELNGQFMTLSVNGGDSFSRVSPGLLPAQPGDSLVVGADENTPAGDYQVPNDFNGRVIDYRVVVTPPSASPAASERPAATSTHSRPNFIFVLADDVSPDDLQVYGNPQVRTPNLLRLASQGLVFDNAYLTISSCSPSRCSMITGRYPHNTGAPELHTKLPESQVTFVQQLREAGYHTALSGKNHMGNAEKLGFAEASGSGPAGSEKWAEHLRDRPRDRPFFFWFASHDAHHPFTETEVAPTFSPDDVQVPPMLFDGPATRQELADYFHEVARSDYYLGQVLDELENQGLAQNTYVIYGSDNGRPFPRCKSFLYDSGIKMPLVIAGPKVAQGRTESLVSSMDLASTIVELAHLTRPTSFQGVSLAPVLEDPETVVRDVAFAERNWHVFQNHQRAVRHGDWLYIWNAWPDRYAVSAESATFTFPSVRELWDAADDGKLTPAQELVTQGTQPAEMLFHVKNDPYQLQNLAANPDHQLTLSQMRQLLEEWKQETGDSVPSNPTPDRQPLHRRGNFPTFQRGEFPGAAHNAASIDRPGPIRVPDSAAN